MPRLLADRSRLKQPTDIERELLDLLSEESGEVVQAVSKIGRHGFDSYHPAGSSDNRSDLEDEIGDFFAAVRLLAACGALDMRQVHEAEESKLAKVFKYLHHVPEGIVKRAQKSVGMRSPQPREPEDG